jgi:hypothetical protein
MSQASGCDPARNIKAQSLNRFFTRLTLKAAPLSLTMPVFSANA